MLMKRRNDPAEKEILTPSTGQCHACRLVRARSCANITELAQDLRERYERIEPPAESAASSTPSPSGRSADNCWPTSNATRNAWANIETNCSKLDVELKDYFTGLIDFPCWMDDREVYLCWRLGEPEVAHWHELDAGFAGRQKLAIRSCRVPA